MKRNSPMLIRLAHPMAFMAFLDDIGANAEGYFERQGLPVRCTDPNAFVPLGRAWALFEDVARREGEDVAWHVGKFVGEHNLHSALIKKLNSAPTLYQALRRLVRLINAEASHLRLGIIEGKNEILLYTTGYFNLKDEPGFSGSQAYQLEVYITLIRHFTGSDWLPRQLGVCARSIPESIRTRFPETRIRLRQPFSYIAIPRHLLHQPPVTKLAGPAASTPLILPDNLSLPETITQLVKPYLPEGYPSIRFASGLMDTSVRTLSRRLSRSGTSYQALLDDLRFRTARDLLRDTSMPIRDIATATGFRDQGNFSRLFRRIAGVSPRQFRSFSV